MDDNNSLPRVKLLLALLTFQEVLKACLRLLFLRFWTLAIILVRTVSSISTIRSLCGVLLSIATSALYNYFLCHIAENPLRLLAARAISRTALHLRPCCSTIEFAKARAAGCAWASESCRRGASGPAPGWVSRMYSFKSYAYASTSSIIRLKPDGGAHSACPRVLSIMTN